MLPYLFPSLTTNWWISHVHSQNLIENLLVCATTTHYRSKTDKYRIFCPHVCLQINFAKSVTSTIYLIIFQIYALCRVVVFVQKEKTTAYSVCGAIMIILVFPKSPFSQISFRLLQMEWPQQPVSALRECVLQSVCVWSHRLVEYRP